MSYNTRKGGMPDPHIPIKATSDATAVTPKKTIGDISSNNPGLKSKSQIDREDTENLLSDNLDAVSTSRLDSYRNKTKK